MFSLTNALVKLSFSQNQIREKKTFSHVQNSLKAAEKEKLEKEKKQKEHEEFKSKLKGGVYVYANTKNTLRSEQIDKNKVLIHKKGIINITSKKTGNYATKSSAFLV